jgi:hypothetical protein
MAGMQIVRNGVGTQYKAFARRAIANQTPAQHMLDVTVELYNAEDVVQKNGPLGILFYVRSKFSAHRYFPVSLTAAGYKCTCYKCTCDHARQAKEHYEASVVC